MSMQVFVLIAYVQVLVLVEFAYMVVLRARLVQVLVLRACVQVLVLIPILASVPTRGHLQRAGACAQGHLYAVACIQSFV